MHFWRNGSITPCNMCFLVILLTGCLLVAAITEHAVVSAGEMHPSGCLLVLDNETHGVKAYCKDLSLTSIPRDLPPNTITLDASLNNITALQNDSFTRIQNLTALNLKHNLICDLDVGTFSPLTKLQTLDMANNKLTNLPHNIFASNKLLSTLVLFSNNLSSVPTDALVTLRLQKIFLDNNHIQKGDFRAFSHSKNRFVINLRRNYISSLQAVDFKPLQNVNVHILDLSHNKLHILPAWLFSYLKKVDYINLNGNKLQEFHLVSYIGNTHVGSLLLNGCRLKSIFPLYNSSFSKTTFSTIDSVDLSINIISNIISFAFWGLNETRTLRFIENRISILSNESFCGLDSLTRLDISSNKISALYPGMFSCTPHLQELIISRNKISLLNPRYFHGLFALRKLDISYNLLSAPEGGDQWNNPALTFINISHNRFMYMNRDLFRGVLGNLHILDVSYNNIKSYSPLTFNNVPSLRVLYLMFVERQYLYRVFSEMKNLIKLDISFAETTLNSTRQFTETRSLEKLRMCQNNLKAPDLFDNRTQSSLFDGLVSLSKLNLHGNFLNNMEPGVFGSLTKLKALDLSKAAIVILKLQIFKGLVSLRTLYLNENNILTTSAQVFSGLDNLGSLYFRDSEVEVLDKDIFSMTPNLRNLFLSGNRLTKVQKDTFFPTNHTLTIDVSANPFSCTCELSWFITWLHESNINLKHPNQTICSRTSIKEVVNLRILMFDPADFCFVNSVNILLITALSFVGVMVGFVSILAYSKRWWLNHKLFLLKLAIIGYQEMAEEFIADNYEFHLNLMFHEAEEEWVDQVLKPGLEERLPHLQNIIYGDKDLHLGMYYVNAIFDAIDNSFKTALLISNQSIDDPWCMTKLRMSLEHLNDTGLDKVILIFLEDIDDDHLPYLVRLFMSRNKPYMLWTENEDGQELFWAQFEKSMRANRAINNIIPV